MKNLLTIFENSAEAIALLSDHLEKIGLKMERSFDMRIQQNGNIACSCLHHGTKECDCQIIVLLIYGTLDGPDSVVAHSRDGRTVFSIAAGPGKPQDADLMKIFQNIRVAGQLSR